MIDGVRQAAVAAGALAAVPYRMIRPRPIDRHFLAGLSDAGIPRGDVEVELITLDQTVRSVPTPLIAEAVRKPRRVGNALTTYVIRHPEVTVLLDPSVCVDVNDRVIGELPWTLRPAVRPRSQVLPTTTALERAGIPADTITFALPTHLHWDHVCGLLDLPGLPVLVRERERDWMMSGDAAPAGGVRAALRGRQVDSYELEGPPVLTFERSHDLLGDGSVIMVELAGHTPGSAGVLLRTANGPVLVAGDAAWHGLQIEHVRQRAPYPGRLVDDDRDGAFRTLHRLHAVRNQVRIIPTHDPSA
ncbi:metallo-beta-lactamase superfamily protein [Micromonospora violae]|uniref:Metallo-beta-lactamase superfamily protein n=1 Tax=Micromonospora violae TaxID=1278207 RepID=A0A4Q7UCX0_9ACTN|nr:MBL fold metallo-hydrolase [Micromonospora violae]RZT79042.1 metallo-beta-lactamase superfamily protein [Micromonospora violae]